MTMADRIAILHNGGLQQVGEPQAVYERPANLFVAGFIGSPPMNTMAGTARVEGGAVSVAIGGGRLGANGDGSIDDGTAVVAGVRPEHLTIGEGPLTATVRAVEWLGHECHVFCDVDGSSVVVRDTDENVATRIGAEVKLGVSPENVHLFDADTTERLN